MATSWPLIVIAGLPAAGKSRLQQLLERTHGVPGGRLVEAHVVPIAWALRSFETVLREAADLLLLREAHPEGVVLVWVEADEGIRARRMEPRVNALAPYNWQSVRGVCQQLVFNNGSQDSFEVLAGRFYHRCLMGVYAALEPGQRAADLGSPEGVSPARRPSRIQVVRPPGNLL